MWCLKVLSSILTLNVLCLFHSWRNRRIATVHNSRHRVHKSNRRHLEQLLSTDPSSALRESRTGQCFKTGLLKSTSWPSFLSLTFKKEKNSLHLPSVTGGVNTLSYTHSPAHVDYVCYSSAEDVHHPALICYEEKLHCCLLSVFLTGSNSVWCHAGHLHPNETKLTLDKKLMYSRA